MNDPTWIIIGFQQKERQDSQDLNNDTLCSLPVTSAQSIIGIEKQSKKNQAILICFLQ